jgi:hypothetical protein
MYTFDTSVLNSGNTTQSCTLSEYFFANSFNALLCPTGLTKLGIEEALYIKALT